MTSPPPTPPDDFDEDASLMLAVQANDPFAFERLMRRNQTRVGAFLLRLVGNPQLAEELTQEVFMRVFKHCATYRQEAKFSTWLYRVAHNVACSALRAENRRPEKSFGALSRPGTEETTSLVGEESVMARTSATPTRQIAKAELCQIVRAAVEKLPARQREAILLSRFNGMSYQEIADVMNLTTQAVKSLLRRARTNLKDALTPYVEDGRRIL